MNSYRFLFVIYFFMFDLNSFANSFFNAVADLCGQDSLDHLWSFLSRLKQMTAKLGNIDSMYIGLLSPFQLHYAGGVTYTYYDLVTKIRNMESLE